MPPGPVSAVVPIPSPTPLQRPGPQDGGALPEPASLLLDGGLAEPALVALAQAAQEIAAEPARETLAAAAGAVAQAAPGAQRDAGGAQPFGTGAASAVAPREAPDPLPAALRLDQRALQQIAWRVPDTERLGLAWRSTLLQAADTRNAASEHALVALALPAGAPLAASGDAAAPLLARTAAGVPAELPGWINVYAWGGMRTSLGVFALDADEPGPPARRRRARIGALRLALEVPGLGRIHACLHLFGGGIALDLGAQSAALMQHVRERLPALATAFGRAELPLARCRLIDLAGLERGGQAATGLGAAQALSPTLFRAATELWAVLAPPLAATVAAAAISPAYR
jgi:hypothetical protein